MEIVFIPALKIAALIEGMLNIVKFCIYIDIFMPFVLVSTQGKSHHLPPVVTKLQALVNYITSPFHLSVNELRFPFFSFTSWGALMIIEYIINGIYFFRAFLYRY